MLRKAYKGQIVRIIREEAGDGGMEEEVPLRRLNPKIFYNVLVLFSSLFSGCRNQHSL